MATTTDEHTQPPVEGTKPVPCIHCNYDLRGLQPHAACPECHTPIQHALMGRPLSAAAPAFRKSIAQALAFLAITLATAAALIPVLAIVYLVITIGGDLSPQTLRHPLTAALVLTATSQIALAAVALTAAERDPQGNRTRTAADTLRRRTRLAAALATAATAAAATATTLAITNNTFSIPPHTADNLAAALIALAVLTATATHAATLRYAATFADRLPNPDLAARYRKLFWFPVQVILGYIIALVLLPFVMLTDLILGVITMTYITLVTLAVPALLLTSLIYAAHLHNTLRRSIHTLDTTAPHPTSQSPAPKPTSHQPA